MQDCATIYHLAANAEQGDLIEIFRWYTLFSHWVVFLGQIGDNTFVAHLTQSERVGTEHVGPELLPRRFDIYRTTLQDAVNNSNVRINNARDRLTLLKMPEMFAKNQSLTSILNQRV